MKVKLLLLAEFEVEGENPADEAGLFLDSFREAVQPSAEYGLCLSRPSQTEAGKLSGCPGMMESEPGKPRKERREGRFTRLEAQAKKRGLFLERRTTKCEGETYRYELGAVGMTSVCKDLDEVEAELHHWDGFVYTGNRKSGA